jgi:hypothetical protein
METTQPGIKARLNLTNRQHSTMFYSNPKREYAPQAFHEPAI